MIPRARDTNLSTPGSSAGAARSFDGRRRSDRLWIEITLSLAMRVVRAGMASVAPNPVVLWFALSGFAAESLLLARHPENVYRSRAGIQALVPVLLLWHWITLGWLVWGIRLGSRALTSSWPRVATILAKGLLAAALAVVSLLYLVSWIVYFRTGQFVSLEMAKLILVNPLPHNEPQRLRAYLAEARSLALGSLVLLPIGFVVARAIPADWQLQKSTGRTKARIGAWCLLTLLTLTGFLRCVVFDRSTMRREIRQTALRDGLNPTFTLVADIHELLREEAIAPCLAANELHPISQDAWKKPAASGENPPSIIYVAVESLRADVLHLRHQGQEVMPHLNALAQNGLELTRAYAQSTHSDYSDVTVPSSLFPLRTRRHHYYRLSDPWPKTLIYDLLKPAGYSTAIISSQNESWGAMDAFLASSNLDLFYDAERSGAGTLASRNDTGLAEAIKLGLIRAGKLDDEHTINVAMEWIVEQARRNVPVFVSINLQDSHFPYELLPDRPRPFQPCALDFNASFLEYPVEKTAVVRNAYFNALHEIDEQLGRLVGALRAADLLRNCILVVYGENGEAFHENGTVTHAREPVEPGLRVACVVHAPGRVPTGSEDYPVGLVDITPTVLAMMGWPCHPNFQGIDVLSSERPPLGERVLFFHTENGLARCDAVLLAGRWKYRLDRKRHREALYDVSVDPGEERNLISQEPALANHLRDLYLEWRQRQLSYYHFPEYYRRYFPPRPPSVGDDHRVAARRERLQ